MTVVVKGSYDGVGEASSPLAFFFFILRISHVHIFGLFLLLLATRIWTMYPNW